MDSRSGSKRARESEEISPEHTSTPTTQEAPAEEPPALDPELEMQMERLSLDDGLRASIRGMSPNSRAEVMRDIELNPSVGMGQHLMFSRFIASYLGASRLFTVLRGASQEQDAENDDAENGDEQNNGDGAGGVGERAENGRPLPRRHGRREHGSILHELLSMADHGQFIQFMSNAEGQLGYINELIAQEFMGVRHNIDEMSYEELLELQDRIGYVSKGITREQMQQCMVEVPPSVKGLCVVCQFQLNEPGDTDGKSVELIKCKHIFHRKCIEEWLTSNKICPTCKCEVV
ncbi:Anaphase promoting complex subunit 11 RING H2 finger RING H2 zinc finger domain [Trypanosoma vivax]|nr:Anaphase promoting complex subunit 11 RING H2 finger RING H2 zinc finger domain [Trypanosoma vivax]